MCTSRKTDHLHHILCFLFVPGLTTIFWAGGLGVKDNLDGLRQVPILRHVIYFCVAEPKLMSTHQNQEHQMRELDFLVDAVSKHQMSWNNKREIICRCDSLIFKEKQRNCVFQVAEVCAK